MESTLASVNQYLTNVGHAVLNKKEEFENGPATPGKPATPAAQQSLAFVTISMIFMLIIGFLCSYGAAKLSWCYNKFNGADNSTCLGWSILAFFFSGLYYPYYGVFLNPLCTLTKTGGGRR
jgi:hypothetical protein